MKNTSNWMHSRFAVVLSLLLIGLGFTGIAQVKSDVLASVANPASGDTIRVQIHVDMSGQAAPEDKLGSFTSTIDWDPAVLAFVGHSGVLQGYTGVVNEANVSTGQLRFNGANINGVGGSFDIIELTFACIGGLGSQTLLDLEYSAMAATTFNSLLENLTVNDITIVLDPSVDIAADEIATAIPEAYELFQNYPNPFNPSTQINIALPASGHVSLKIYDIAGREVAVLLDEQMLPGTYQLNWEAKDVGGYQLSSGIYLYRLQAGQFSETRRMILLR